MSRALLDRLGRWFKSPLFQALFFYAIFLGLSLVLRRLDKGFPLLVGAASMTIYSVAAPIALVFAPRFWLRLLLALVLWLVLFVAIAGTCEALQGRLKEDAMIFLGAFMIFPVALVLAGILRLVFRRRLTGAAASAPPPPPPIPAAGT